MIYVNNGNMRIVFDFIVFSLIGKWIWFFFSIRNNGVMFYKDCREVDIKFLFMVLGNLIFLCNSVLYIGRVGWILGVLLSVF